MDWLNSLFIDIGSIGHIVFLYALVISLGVKLGKIKIGGISLGVTFVLFVGILAGHIYNSFGIDAAVPIDVLTFIQEFGLILFVYCIGLQVGPGFFESFKEGGVRLNALATGIVLLNIGMMFILYFLFFDTSDAKNLPMMVGVLCGAITNTPGLGAASSTLEEVLGPNFDAIMHGQGIASGYACAYPLGVVGIIFSTIALRYICKINLKKETEKVHDEQNANPHAKPSYISIKVTNPALIGKNLAKVQSFLGRYFVCTYYKHNGETLTASKETVLSKDDILNIVCPQDEVEAIEAFLGEEVNIDWEIKATPIISKRVIVTQTNINGKTFGEMHFSSLYDVNVTRITRNGLDIFASRNLRLQLGDRIMVVGKEDSVCRVADLLGNSIKRLHSPNVAAIFLGVMLGMILGSIPIPIPGVPNSIKLGLAGGPLIIAILVGRFGYKAKIVAYTTTSANLMVREIGLILFLASVGIKAGANFWSTIMDGDGIKYVWCGFLITTVPIIIIGLIARLKYKINYFIIMGMIAGSATDPPALAFATQSADNDMPAIGYSTVYPLTMFLRILSAQLIILFMCS